MYIMLLLVDACRCPNTINSKSIPIGVSNTESVEILSVCSGKPCDDSCSNYTNCKVHNSTVVDYIFNVSKCSYVIIVI